MHSTIFASSFFTGLKSIENYMKRRQLTNHILMIRPANFGYNPETAESNAFQVINSRLSNEEVKQVARKEFDTFVEKLRANDIIVTVVEDTPTPVKPDCVFPNNWISFHADGRVATYPMLAPLRRLERREDLISDLANSYHITERVHFEGYENLNLILEGTGSLVLDRMNRLAYACLSPRTDMVALDAFCEKMGYQKVAFESLDKDGQQIYHTNVMMAMGTDYVVICMESIKDKTERAMIEKSFADTGKEIVDITYAQMNAFCGNMLHVVNTKGNDILIMSQQAFEALRADQIQFLETKADILTGNIPGIEQVGGGSVRCMMAEVFLDPKSN